MKLNRNNIPDRYLLILAVVLALTIGLYALTATAKSTGSDTADSKHMSAVGVLDRLPVILVDGGVASQQLNRNQINDGDTVIYDDHQAIQVRAQDQTQLQDLQSAIETKRIQLQAQLQAVDDFNQTIYQNQNQARLAASTLEASADMLGTLGPVVRRLADEYKETVVTTIQTEAQMQNRSMTQNFLFGADEDTVATLRENVALQKEKTENISRLITVWDGDPEVQALLQENIQVMEQEQLRLQKLADKEATKRGLFDYIFFWRS
jgi:hypothetical protein